MHNKLGVQASIYYYRHACRTLLKITLAASLRGWKIKFQTLLPSSKTYRVLILCQFCLQNHKSETQILPSLNSVYSAISQSCQ